MNYSVNLSSSKVGSSSYHCTTTLYGENEETQKNVSLILLQLRNLLRRFLFGRWSCLELGSEKKWYGTYSVKPDGDWDKTADRMRLNFAESGHPVFRATSALERGESRSKGKGNKSIHFNGSDETIELILRTIISVTKLSIYGAVSDSCKELSNDSEVAGKLAANEELESMDTPTELAIGDPYTNAELQGNLLQDYEHNFEQLPEDQKLSKLCSDACLKIVEKRQFFITLEEEGPGEMKKLFREYALLRSEEASRVRGSILRSTKISPVLDIKVCLHQKRYGIEIMVESMFRDRAASWVRIVNGVN